MFAKEWRQRSRRNRQMDRMTSDGDTEVGTFESRTHSGCETRGDDALGAGQVGRRNASSVIPMTLSPWPIPQVLRIRRSKRVRREKSAGWRSASRYRSRSQVTAWYIRSAARTAAHCIHPQHRVSQIFRRCVPQGRFLASVSRRGFRRHTLARERRWMTQHRTREGFLYGDGVVVRS